MACRHGGNVADRLGGKPGRPGVTGILELSNMNTSGDCKIAF